MNIAILGGSGFIGSYLCKLLNELGINFKILDIAKPELYIDKWEYCDITDRADLKNGLINITHIINLAAEHKDNVSPVSLYYEVNVQGARNLCDIAFELGIKHIIFTSSVAVYGFVDKDTDENGECKPFNDYGISKLKAEEIYDKWKFADDKNSLVIIRPTVVFGVGNRGNVYNLFNQIASGKFLMIGSGDNKKSMAYIENIIAFIIYCFKFETGRQVFNYVDKPDYTMNELASVISNSLNQKMVTFKLPYYIGLGIGYCFDFFSFITQRKFTISSIRVKKFCASTQFKSSIIQSTDYVAPMSLKNAIEKTVKHEFDCNI